MSVSEVVNRRVNGASDPERLARIIWSHLVEPALQPLPDKVPESLRWLRELGPVEALDRLCSTRVGDGSAARARLEALDLDGVLRGHDRFAVRVLVPGDDGWPEGVDDLDQPPLCLYVRGALDLSHLRWSGIAVVGSRAATPYGSQVARRMASDLTDRGVVVVSGAAFGIDAAAHEGALIVGGPTVAVLACGVDRPYPTAHAELIGRIRGDGAVISEVPLGFAPYRQRFLSRNRLIAAMTTGTVVVEAGARSGSLNTAGSAESLSRHVGMVPGPVTSMGSVGCHDWIRTHRANLVTDAADVLDLMGRLGVHVQDTRRGPEFAEDLVEPGDRGLWSAVPVRSGADLMTLSRASGLSIPSTLAGLGRLVLAGLVERQDDVWRKVSSTRRPA
jgi:DNA processing protein